MGLRLPQNGVFGEAIMSELQEIIDRDGPETVELRPPVQRAAYSDRIAWQMAIMAELAYVKFEPANDKLLESLAQELAEANGVSDIAAKLLTFRDILKTPDTKGEDKLKAALKAAEFELVGTFYNKSVDLMRNTEGFVAKKVGGGGRDFAVLSIRGTTTPQDWINNAKINPEAIGGGRKVHAGFLKAFRDAESQMETLLEEAGNLPLFVTGHSLGGAVAVMSTWYFKRDTLAACYTFGAPRVGNHKFNDDFHTPIYRVVNAVDPVPMVPPPPRAISVLKFVLRIIGKVLPIGWVMDWVVGSLTNVQGYRHAGNLLHMTAGEMADNGSYPTVEYYTQFGFLDRVARVFSLMKEGRLKRLDIYHNMATYRRKLRSRALDRAPK
jgi:hypothetical protein